METRETVEQWLRTMPVPEAPDRSWIKLHGPARRLLEEAVELCIATGMTPGTISDAVMDSISNESRKHYFPFPSQMRLEFDMRDVAAEATDVQIQLWNLWRFLNAAYKAPVQDDRSLEQRMLDVKMIGFRSSVMIVHSDGAYYKAK